MTDQPTEPLPCPIDGCTIAITTDVFDHLPLAHGATGVAILAEFARRLAATDADFDAVAIAAAVAQLRADRAQHRDQVLTEGAEIILTTRGALNGAEWPDHAAGLLLAARTSQES